MATVAQMDALGLRQTIREELDRSGLANLVRQLQADAVAATALPSSALAGQEVYLQTAAMAAMSPPVKWLLRYDGSRWLPVSCPPLFAEVPASEATASTTYVALATPGPALSVPVTGDYDVEIGATMAGGNPWMSYDVGAAAAVDADGFVHAAAFAAGNRPRRRLALAAGTTLTAKYRNSAAASGNARERWMRATPVRLG